MVSVDFSIGIALFFVIFLSVVLGVWLFKKKQKEKKLRLDARYIWYCSVCTYNYINTKEERISLCPRCGSYNKKTEA